MTEDKFKLFVVKRTTHLVGYALDYKNAIEKAKKGQLGQLRSWYSAKENK